MLNKSVEREGGELAVASVQNPEAYEMLVIPKLCVEEVAVSNNVKGSNVTMGRVWA
jgi:hypothetical protein